MNVGVEDEVMAGGAHEQDDDGSCEARLAQAHCRLSRELPAAVCDQNAQGSV